MTEKTVSTVCHYSISNRITPERSRMQTQYTDKKGPVCHAATCGEGIVGGEFHQVNIDLMILEK